MRGTPVRRARWVAALAAPLLALPLSAALAPPALAAGGTFVDDDTDVHEGMIEAVAAAGITTGCTDAHHFCPTAAVTREQMASFLSRALSLPPAGRDYFSDDATSAHQDDINRVAAAGITTGRGDGTFGPRAPVTRAQMAAFLERALHLPASSTDHFRDDDGSLLEPSIDAIAAAGITAGCDSSGTRYCPGSAVRRDQMASFLGRALHLTPVVLPPAPAGFGAGTFRVGSEVTPGTYRAVSPSPFCYWERLSGFGGSTDEIIANDLPQGGPVVVTIAAGDAGFTSHDCGTWSTDLSPLTSSPTAAFGAGIFQVGSEVAAGTWRARTPGDSCYWERLSGFGGSTDEIISNDLSKGPALVDVAPGDKGFSSHGCGSWTRDLSPVTSAPTAPFGDGSYLVGTDISAGTWRTTTATGSCYWERLSGFGGTLDDIISNDFGGQTVVDVAAGDRGFSSHGCGTWTKVG